MKKISVYKIDNKGRERVWSIGVEGNVESETEHANIIIESGLVDGGKVTETIKITKGLNKNKSNSTTPYNQAVKESEAKLKLKLRSGYVENLEDLKESGTLGSGIKAPMLAQKFDSTLKQKGSKDLTKLKIEGKLVGIEPKIDGTRGLAKINAEGVEMYTRKGDRYFPIPHIEEQLLESYNNSKFKGTEVIIDGELYTDTISFNTLNGLLRKENKSEEDLDKLQHVNYIIYDTYSDLNYRQRYEIIKHFQSENVLLIPFYEIVATDTNIQEKLEEFLALNYEGAMLRLLDVPYEHKRSWSLLKNKVFESFEAKLLGIEADARGGGLIGGFILEMPTTSKDRDGKAITTFKAGVSGLTQEEQKQITENIQDYIGNPTTIECFGFSEYGVARFPKVKQLNRTDI